MGRATSPPTARLSGACRAIPKNPLQFRHREETAKRNCLASRVKAPRVPPLTMQDEIKATPASKLVDMTRALPEIPNGDYPRVYEQVIVGNANSKADAVRGKPDPTSD